MPVLKLFFPKKYLPNAQKKEENLYLIPIAATRCSPALVASDAYTLVTQQLWYGAKVLLTLITHEWESQMGHPVVYYRFMEGKVCIIACITSISWSNYVYYMVMYEVVRPHIEVIPRKTTRYAEPIFSITANNGPIRWVLLSGSIKRRESVFMVQCNACSISHR